MKLESSIITDLVRLDVLAESHREVIKQSKAVDAMWNWMPLVPTGTSFDAYFNYVLGQAKSKQFIPYVITRQSDGEWAGLAGFLDINKTHRRLRIGYVWHPLDMRGTVIGPATQLAMMSHARQARMHRITWQVPEKNTRAIAAFGRYGATVEGTLRKYQRLTNGEWSNAVILSLVDNEIDAAIDLLRDRVATLIEA